MNITELASRVFQARDCAHRAHWQTRSFSAHQALGEFYSDSIDAVDAVVEAYIGLTGPLDGTFEVNTKPVEDMVEYLRQESDDIEAARDGISQGSAAVSALIDVLVAVYLKCIFKLESFT